MRKLRPRLSFANVISLIALFVALGGGAYAVTLAKNSVKSKQIKNGQVKNADLGANSVDGSKVADGSLDGGDIDEGSLSVPLADGSVGPSKLARQPHVEVSRVAAQTLAPNDAVIWDRVGQTDGFAVQGPNVTVQVPGVYLVQVEGIRATSDFSLSTGDPGQRATRLAEQVRVFSKVLRLDAGQNLRVQNVDGLTNIYGAGSNENPSVQLVAVRIGG
jgi:hypothetical protein